MHAIVYFIIQIEHIDLHFAPDDRLGYFQFMYDNTYMDYFYDNKISTNKRTGKGAGFQQNINFLHSLNCNTCELFGRIVIIGHKTGI